MTATSTSIEDAIGSGNGKTGGEGFLETVLREAGYRRCLILDGNVRDVFPDGRGHYLRLAELLVRRLRMLGSG